MKSIIDHLNQLNKIFDNRKRLGIMSILMVNDWVEYKTLKNLLKLTDGNLASHMKALEKQEYIKVYKKFVGRKPNTTYAITNTGERDFQDHLKALEKLILFNAKETNK